MDYDTSLNFDTEELERCEEQTKLELITPALERAGWLKNQFRMEYVTRGQILIDKFRCVRD